jgi:acyl-CoA hydrolase
MKVGDLVIYRGWAKQAGSDPLAIVVEVRADDSEYHKRIRVMWMGEDVPIQAQVISVTGDRFSSWCSPKYFEVVEEDHEKTQDPDDIWKYWGNI